MCCDYASILARRYCLWHIELSFPPVGYSPGNRPLDGYMTISVGGECLEGYKMALNVQSLGNHHTTQYMIV